MVDVLVMGRKTYKKLLTFGERPYGNKPVVVLTRGAVTIPEGLAQSVEAMACTPCELVRRLSKRGAKHLYVDGGESIQGFLREGLIRQIIITTIPILLSSGIPFFEPLPCDTRLRHMETRQFPNGLVQSRYEVSE